MEKSPATALHPSFDQKLVEGISCLAAHGPTPDKDGEDLFRAWLRPVFALFTAEPLLLSLLLQHLAGIIGEMEHARRATTLDSLLAIIRAPAVRTVILEMGTEMVQHAGKVHKILVGSSHEERAGQILAELEIVAETS
jgi:hypothetical protein